MVVDTAPARPDLPSQKIKIEIAQVPSYTRDPVSYTHLMGVLYILDEPSIGLHQRDNERLIATLERLRDLGNTVVVVEHDEDVYKRQAPTRSRAPSPTARRGF